MCSVFKSLDMDNFQGDLTDVVRGLGSGHVSSSPGPTEGPSPNTLSPPPPPQSTTSDLFVDFSSAVADSQARFLHKEDDDNFRTGTAADSHQILKPFGDPFVTITDPLLQELNLSANSGYFSAAAGDNNNNENNNSNNSNTNNGFAIIPKVFEEDRIKSQCSIFPRIRISQSNMIHDASTCNSPVIAAHGTTSAAVASPWGIINVVEATNSPRNCVLMDNNNNNTSSSQIQISSSPRNLGIKRRKSQAKKVVCIPAPAAMNSRSSGEVVPSDLWAWRKYGQKPIKGSPYPRGYYRCSSSKGCSARKQVERSRNDPNMLVITYTSEHNHPWPTQRNALAGSTRSSNPSSKPLTATATASTAQNNNKEDEPNKTHLPPYRPESFNHNPEDFFADLDELEGDSLTMLLSQGFNGGTSNLEDKTTALPDVFSDFFDDDTSSKSL